MREYSRSRALSEANKVFKSEETKTLTDYEMAQQSFRANRERLKAERLARDIKPKSAPTNARSHGRIAG
jgi:hypothetical protein